MPDTEKRQGPLRLQWLGVSSWILARGDDVVVVDPFFSRPSLDAVMLSMALPWLATPMAYDATRIQEVLPDLPHGTRVVLITHAHYDHLLDIPYYVGRPRSSGVPYGGSATALNLLRAFPVPPPTTWEARDGAATRVGNVRVTALATDHAPQLFGLCLMTGDVDSPPPVPPRAARDYRGGQNFSYLIDFMDGETVVARVFVNGSASSPSGAASLHAHREMLRQHAVDVAVLCVPGWDHVEGYPESVLEVLRPAAVVTSHFDNFFRRYRAGEDPRNGMEFVAFARYPDFVSMLRRLQEEHGYRYTIREPATGEWLELGS